MQGTAGAVEGREAVARLVACDLLYIALSSSASSEHPPCPTLPVLPSLSFPPCPTLPVLPYLSYPTCPPTRIAVWPWLACATPRPAGAAFHTCCVA